MSDLKAPFPWFGGKRRVASAVWERFGKVPNYVEPFAGSIAMLLNRPSIPKIETVNDIDGFITNFWRSIKHDPREVAKWADWPVNELDLHSRHEWLQKQRATLPIMLREDASYYSPLIAGWWVWGQCAWVGPGWCTDAGLSKDSGTRNSIPMVSQAGQGISRASDGRTKFITDWFLELSDRLRETRVICGDWTRVCTPAVTHGLGLTGVFLDPPYGATDRCVGLYAEDDTGVAGDVRAWCEENGENPLLRIALCGYEGEDHHRLEDMGWNVYEWKANGGYANRNNRGANNAKRERIWFSPHCLPPDQEQLF